MRSTRAAVVLMLVLAACGGRSGGDASGPASYGGGIPDASSSSPAAGGTRPGGAGAGGGQPDDAFPPPGTGGGQMHREPNPYPDGGEVGAMSRMYLRPSPAERIIVEIDYVVGREPTQQARDHVRAILARETRKRVDIRVDDEIDRQEGSYSFDEIRQMERRFRDLHSEGSVATMWIVYLDGSLKGESGTVGVAYTASSAAIFYDHIRDAATAIVGADHIERAVLTHEAGHLLALVNIGYTSRHDHEDPQHRGHSKNRGSVMYWQIEDKGLVALISGGPADDFDQADRDDLAMLRAG